MIIGIGIDSIEIERSSNFLQYSKKSLEKIFSKNEINYCHANPKKSTERFAARFAAKEAFYKALCSAFPDFNFGKQVFRRACLEHQKNGHIRLNINWAILFKEKKLPHIPAVWISLTHTKTTATAIVILEKN